MLYGNHPWVIKSMNDLSQKPLTIPLRFPRSVNVSESTKDFIKGCLGVQENQRLEWNQVLNHPTWKQMNNVQNAPYKRGSIQSIISSNPNLKGPRAR